jgi:PAS domain-containing protein
VSAGMVRPRSQRFAPKMMRRMRSTSLNCRGSRLKVTSTVLSAGLSISNRSRVVVRDGKPLWVQMHVSLLRDAAGEPTGMIALVTGMAERKRYEERLRESEERLRFALDAAQLGTWRWDGTEGPDAVQADARCKVLLRKIRPLQMSSPLAAPGRCLWSIRPHHRALSRVRQWVRMSIMPFMKVSFSNTLDSSLRVSGFNLACSIRNGSRRRARRP